jgi:xylulokinase
MVPDILLGIDLGTTELKVCAFHGKTGRALASAARRLKVHTTSDGGREQRPRAVGRAFQDAVRQVRETLGDSWRTVAGIGLAAQGGSSILVDRSTGKPNTSMILWNDGRAHAHVARIAERTSKDYWRTLALRDVASAGLGRLLWLKEAQPDLFTDDHLHVGAGEYLFFMLTGVWRQDAGNALQIGSYSAVTRKLDGRALDLAGIPLSFVAPLRRGHETAPLSKRGARMLGLPEGVPVAGPYIDQEAGYLSATGSSDKPLHVSLGTAWVGNFVLPDRTAGNSPLQLVLPGPTETGRLVVQPLLTGNTTWDWALETFVDSDQTQALRKAKALFAKSLLPPPGLVVLPWLVQDNPLHRGTCGGGAVLGMSAKTSRGDLLRASAAGMAYELARVFEHVRCSGVVDAVVLAGGASKGAHFRTLLSALFAPLPMHWQTDEDMSAARGAVFAFRPQAARSKSKKVPLPTARLRQDIEAGYQNFRSTFDAVYDTVPEGRAFHFDRPVGRNK